jgi:hypothetical protein
LNEKHLIWAIIGAVCAGWMFAPGLTSASTELLELLAWTVQHPLEALLSTVYCLGLIIMYWTGNFLIWAVIGAVGWGIGHFIMWLSPGFRRAMTTETAQERIIREYNARQFPPSR